MTTLSRPSFSTHQLAGIKGRHVLFSDLSLQLHSGDLLIIEGPNGSGKSTLLKILSGILSPSAGDIFWEQLSIQKNPAYRENMHYIAHLNGIKSGLTINENLQLMQYLANAAQINHSTLLTTLGLHDHQDQLAGQLSAGQKRRLALAKLFCINKPLWLLDEPLTALDHATETLFITHLEHHLQNGGIAVISTHHPIALQYRSIKKLRLPLC